MLEVNAIYFILLAEGFVLLLILLLAWLLATLVGRRRKRRDIARLAVAIRDRTAARGQQTRTFLQAVYQLDGEDLRMALADIENHEIEFFQHLIDSLYRGSNARIALLDRALDQMIESYKCLQPRVDVVSHEVETAVEEISTLRGENETLREELSVAQSRLDDLITEFGEIFGGGKDHQLTLQQVIDKVDAVKADQANAATLQAQK